MRIEPDDGDQQRREPDHARRRDHGGRPSGSRAGAGEGQRPRGLDRREHRDEQGRPAPDPEPAVGGHRAASSRARTRSAIVEGRRQTVAPGALALGHLGPAAAPAVDRGRPPRGRGRRPTIPRATRSSLTVTKSCGSSASRPSAMTPDAEQRRGRPSPRPSSRRWTRTGRRRRRARTPGRDLLGAARRGRRASGAPPAAAPPAFSRRFVSRSSSWRARIRSGSWSAVWAPAASVAAASASTRDRRYASAPAPGERLDPAHARSRCCARR